MLHSIPSPLRLCKGAKHFLQGGQAGTRTCHGAWNRPTRIPRGFGDVLKNGELLVHIALLVLHRLRQVKHLRGCSLLNRCINA